MHITLIVNPDAGDATQPSPGQLRALIKEAGHKVRLQSVKEKGWAKALKRPADMIAVAGGDGTVGKVARRLIGTTTPLAILPMGTANNISKTLGILDWSPLRLIPAWAASRTVTFDAGTVTGPWGTRYFIEGVGLGFFPCALPDMKSNQTLQRLTEAHVKVSYALQLLRDRLGEHEATRINAALDGKDVSGEYVLFEVMNMRYIGPNLYLAPELVHNDGHFEIVCVEKKHRRDLHKYLADWQDGKQWPPEFVTRLGRELQFEWTGFPIHIDDKLWPAANTKVPKHPATISARIEPGAVRFVVPPEIYKSHHAPKPPPAAKKRASKRRR